MPQVSRTHPSHQVRPLPGQDTPPPAEPLEPRAPRRQGGGRAGQTATLQNLLRIPAVGLQFFRASMASRNNRKFQVTMYKTDNNSAGFDGGVGQQLLVRLRGLLRVLGDQRILVGVLRQVVQLRLSLQLPGRQPHLNGSAQTIGGERVSDIETGS